MINGQGQIYRNLDTYGVFFVTHDPGKVAAASDKYFFSFFARTDRQA